MTARSPKHKSIEVFVFTIAMLLFAVARTDASDSNTTTTISVTKIWGEQGSAPGEFDFPIAIAINAKDEIFISDHYNSRVQKFDTDGKFISEFTTLPSPGAFALDREGNFYITHFPGSKKQMDKYGRGNFVSVYAPDGTMLRQWGKMGVGDGEFDCPGGLAISAEDRVYIADQTNHRVQVFDTMGKFLFKWGEYGNEPGQFGGMEAKYARTGGPQFVALDSEGHVWTTEGMNGRIQEFTADGKFLRAWGDNQDKPGSFGGAFAGFNNQPTRLQGPIALCFDVHDHLWISAVCGRIQRFSKSGEFLGGIGQQGDQPGQFYAPHGVALDSSGALYVVDAFNHRIQKLRPSP